MTSTGIYVNGHYIVPRALDDTARNMLADMDPGCEDHEWYDGECQRCGETHPDDCLGCDPRARGVADDHEYQEPDTDTEYDTVAEWRGDK